MKRPTLTLREQALCAIASVPISLTLIAAAYGIGQLLASMGVGQ